MARRRASLQRNPPPRFADPSKEGMLLADNRMCVAAGVKRTRFSRFEKALLFFRLCFPMVLSQNDFVILYVLQ